MKRTLKENMMKIFYKIEDCSVLAVIRRGLTMLVPVLVVGAMACAILYFPNESFQYLIGEQMPVISLILKIIYQGTFGMFSMCLVISLSISYAMEKSEEVDNMFFYITTAVASFGMQIGMVGRETQLDILGYTGSFFALLVGSLSCAMFYRLRKVESISLRKYTVGMERIPANAIQSILPSAITIGSFAFLQYAVTAISGEESLYTLLKEIACRGFEGAGNGFFSAFLYTLLVHVLWVLGFQGSHMMETVALDNFSVIGKNVIFSKSFFDTFVMMGGCGTAVCVLIGIFLSSRKKRMRNIGKIALPTVIFNANEILNFGIPIILNPILAIPFICVPIMALVVSYGAVALGFVPCVAHEIKWTMPILFSGYMATGSIAGSILQLLIIVLGVAMYVPFLKMYEEIYELRMKEKIEKLIKGLQECEKKGESPDFLLRMDDTGMVARMLLQDLKVDLKNKKLYLVYQPQVNRKGKYLGGEALLRWKHSEYGYIYPPLIIYLATEGGILPKLERELVDMSVEAIRQISRKCEEDFKVSINITAHSLEWEIEKYIKEKLEEQNIPAEKLWLEITEQDVLTNSEVAAEKIRQLKKAGHKLLIDDFGMGHTSLIYLQSDYFDVVKLDGSLVRNILKGETNQNIVAAIVELGRKIGIGIIAEYVETEELKQKLEELGCYCYQGYLYGKPMPLEEFIEKLCENHLRISEETGWENEEGL